MEALIYPRRSSITEWFCQSARVTITLSRFRTDEHFAFPQLLLEAKKLCTLFAGYQSP